MAKQADTNPAFDGLKHSLKSGDFHAGYIFWGQETYLLQYYLSQLKSKVVDPLTEEFNYHRFSSETFSMEALSDSVEAIPMMAERSMVQVDDVDLFKLDEEQRNRLIDLLSDLPDYCCLVFTYAASDYKPDKRQKKLYDAITKNLQTVEFAKQSVQELSAWITRHFRGYNKVISSSLCRYLIDITDGTMASLLGEIDKIASYAVDAEIRKSDIDAVVEPVLEAVVFEMTDQLGEGNYDGALQKLHTLFKMQQEPIPILGAIGAHMRRLSCARILMDSGKGSDELMKLCSMGDYPARKTMSAARSFSARFCRKAAQLILETDGKLKTSYDDEERLLELLILQLAQEARNG